MLQVFSQTKSCNKKINIDLLQVFGKSRLIGEFGKKIRTLYFLGLAPEDKITANDQRKHFANQFEKQLGIGGLLPDDWDHLFGHLVKHTNSGQVLIVLDEINWMGSKDPTFLPKLKTVWDAEFSKNPQLIMILSGSMSGWIEENILSSTGQSPYQCVMSQLSTLRRKV